MLNYINRTKHKGNAFIATIVALFILLAVVFALVIQLKPLTIYSNLKEVGRMAILKMESDGGITSDTRNMITNTLNFDGYNKDYLIISPSTDVTSSTIPDYGSKLTLDLIYAYHYKFYSMAHLFEIDSVEKTMNITVHISTTSKKAQ